MCIASFLCEHLKMCWTAWPKEQAIPLSVKWRPWAPSDFSGTTAMATLRQGRVPWTQVTLDEARPASPGAVSCRALSRRIQIVAPALIEQRDQSFPWGECATDFAQSPPSSRCGRSRSARPRGRLEEKNVTPRLALMDAACAPTPPPRCFPMACRRGPRSHWGRAPLGPHYDALLGRRASEAAGGGGESVCAKQLDVMGHKRP